jgi:hypothetical protein
MDERARAEEHLQVIRSLMERVTTYRTISAPTALVGGLSSLAVAGWLLARSGVFGDLDRPRPLGTREFIVPWIVPLVLTIVANTFFLWRGARRESRPFLSSGLRLALRSLLPAILIAGAITFVALRNPTDLDGPLVVTLTWISCYGLALLATMNFAPRSLSVLGWSFVVTALFWLLLISAPNLPIGPAVYRAEGATFAMGLTFGVYHLLYAVTTWSSDRPRATATERE